LNLAGDYSITLLAQNCDTGSRWPAPPTELRSRTYASRLEQDGTNIRVVISGLPRIFYLEHSALWGQIQADNSVTLTNYYGQEQWDSIFEQVSSTNLLSILVDEMKLGLSPQGLSGTFSGSFLVYDGTENHWPSIGSACFSKSHSVTFTRDSSR